MSRDPLSDANEAIRASYSERNSERGCEIVLHLTGEAVLARFVKGDAEFRKAWESRREVVNWGWAEDVQKPRNVSEQNWKIREICWRAAQGKPGLPTGFTFNLLDGAPPTLGWGGVRRHLPTIEQRVRAVIHALDMGSPANPGEAAEFRRKLAARLPDELTREHLSSYGSRQATSAPVTRRSASNRTDLARKAMIDHADVIRASDGRIFVAAPYVGLDTSDRVFIQVADTHVAFIQNAVQFGYVADVPRTAVELLRDCRTVNLVEVERSKGQRLLRAKHVAIVQDISLSDPLNRSMGRWRAKGANQGNEGEIRQWDSGQPTTSE